MTEIEKKGLDYFDKQIEKGNINVLVMIGELLEKNQQTQNYYENGLDDINNDYSYRIKQLQKENEELKNGSLLKELTERVKQQAEQIEKMKCPSCVWREEKLYFPTTEEKEEIICDRCKNYNKWELAE